jgi:hypothetical protein
MPCTCKHIQNGWECRYGCTAFVSVCHSFVRAGNCRFGDRCRFFHPEPEQHATCKHRRNGRECPHGCTLFVTVCHQFVHAGNCNVGDRCRLFHPDQEQRAEQNQQNGAQEPSNAQQEPETVIVWPDGPVSWPCTSDLVVVIDSMHAIDTADMICGSQSGLFQGHVHHSSIVQLETVNVSF